MGVQKGDRVEKGQTVAEIVPDGQVCVEIREDETEAARILADEGVELSLGMSVTVRTGEN